MQSARWCLAFAVTALASFDPPLCAETATLPAVSVASAVDAALARDDPATAAKLARAPAESGRPDAQFVLGLLQDLGAGVRLDRAAASTWVEKSAAQGYLPAQRYLAWRYGSGFGAEAADAVLAARWRDAKEMPEVAIEPGLSRWVEADGGELKPKLSRALLWMMDEAGRNAPIAEANLAAVYLSSFWTPADPDQHLHWLMAAARHGDVPSLERLAGYYDSGGTVPLDPAKALACRQAAAEAGSVAAQFLLGLKYERGDGVPASGTQAVKYYRLAAAQNHLDALHNLIVLTRNGGAGLSRDLPEALRLCRQGAELGDAEAITNLADLYNRGDAVTRDYAKSAELYRQAAAKGYVRAMTMLGWIYANGETGPEDYVEARRWYEQAAAKDSTRAMWELAHLYRHGLGVKTDAKTEFEWAERAARAGYAEAQRRVGEMLLAGTGIEADADEAAEWIALAAKNGHNGARQEIARAGGQNEQFVSAAAVEQAVRAAIAAARDGAESSVRTPFFAAFRAIPIAQRPALRRLLLDALAPPDAMSLRGALPELALEVVETGPIGLEDAAAAGSLLERMAQAGRPQSRRVLAWHAFLGWHMTLAPARALAWAREAAADGSPESAVLLSHIGSFAAPTEELRKAARRALVKLADKGNKAAVQIVACEYANGFGGTQDVSLALEYQKELGRDAFAVTDVWGRSRNHFTVRRPPPVRLDETIAGEKKKLAADRTAQHPPKLVYKIVPRYPVECLIAGIDGEVKVDFIVGTEGQAEEIHARDGAPPLLAAAAEACVRVWRFVPAYKAGRPVRTRVLQSFTFNHASDY